MTRLYWQQHHIWKQRVDFFIVIDSKVQPEKFLKSNSSSEKVTTQKLESSKRKQMSKRQPVQTAFFERSLKVCAIL